MAEIPGVLKFPDGLTPGAAKGGGLSGLVYDSGGNLVDHAVFHPDVPTPSSGSGPVTWKGVAVGVAITLTAVGIGYAGVRINRWVTTRRAEVEALDDSDPAPEVSYLDVVALAEMSESIELTLADGVDMSSREAFERLVAIMIAAEFIAAQMRALANARIADDAEFPELSGALERLTTQKVTDTINQMIETKTLTLDEEMSANFLASFGGGAFVENHYVPLSRKKVQEALRLPESPPDPATGK